VRELRPSGGAEPADEDLVRHVAAGDERAFDELVRRYASRLAQYAARLLGDAGAGRDVSQLALISAYRSLRQGAVPAGVRAWLYRLTLNASLELRGQRRESAARVEFERSPDAKATFELPHELSTVVGQLSEQERRAFVLREVYGLRISEIAASLELSPQQVEQALFAARNLLSAQAKHASRCG
jgi:RNA polymerase sigma-70 factor, ECF subfamily